MRRSAGHRLTGATQPKATRNPAEAGILRGRAERILNLRPSVPQTDNTSLKELTKPLSGPESQGNLPRPVLGSDGRFEKSRGLDAAC